MLRRFCRLFAAGALVIVAGCGAPAQVPHTLQFEFATRGNRAANCTAPSGHRVVRTLKFYVHDIELLGTDRSVPLSIDDAPPWQNGQVALVSLPGCEGTQTARLSIQGMALPGDYQGVRFTLGVPFASNHLNPAAATAPLNVGSMFWTWQLGYKFLRFDTDTRSPAVNGWSFHLGSEGCRSPSAVRAPVEPCEWPNRPVITLVGATSRNTVIRIDAAALLLPAERRGLLARSCMGNFHEGALCPSVLEIVGLDAVTGKCADDCRGQTLFRLAEAP